MDIYIKLIKKYNVLKNKNIYLKEIAEVVCDKSVLDEVKNLIVLNINDNKKTNYIISIIQIIEMIKNKFDKALIYSLGEKEVLIEYEPNKKKENKIFNFIKICFVSLVLFAGSSTAIMTFHNESQISVIFSKYYEIFFNEKLESIKLMEIPYSIGLFFGIIIFFNHFVGKKITNEPTPIEIEISTYETSVFDTTIDKLNKEQTETRKINDNN